MEVGVRVEAENPVTGERRRTNTAYLTMVALDEAGRPAPVPPLLGRDSPAEQRRMREAELRRANRLAEREEIVARRARETLSRPAERCPAARGGRRRDGCRGLAVAPVTARG